MGTAATSTLGQAFAEAVARKDFERVRALLAPQIDFRALTPRRSWEAGSPQEVVDEALSVWFGEDVQIERLAGVETGVVGDRERVAYRFHGSNEDGPFVLEQQVYYTVADGRIAWMRVLCSGFRSARIDAKSIIAARDADRR